MKFSFRREEGFLLLLIIFHHQQFLVVGHPLSVQKFGFGVLEEVQVVEFSKVGHFRNSLGKSEISEQPFCRFGI